MKIQILGPGCSNCSKLADNVKQAADELGLDYEMVKITDPAEIMKFRVLMTPGFAVDGEVKASGKPISVEEIKKLLV